MRRVVLLRCRHEDVLWFDVAMEEFASVDVLEACKNLKENALYTRVVQRLVVSGLHQLVEVAVHVLHGDVKSPAVGIQEDVKSRDQVGMRWE